MTPARPQKLLIISYLFPPAGGIGVQRALSLAKYFPACGFEVHVLRANNAAAPVKDPGLLKQLPPQLMVHNAPTPELPFGFRQGAWRWLSPPKGGSRPAVAAAQSGQSRLKSMVTGLVRRVLSPEPEVLWVPFALRKARRIVRRHGIEVVLVTAPPFSAFLVGNALKREFPYLTLVSDFRDEWLKFYLGTFDFQKGDYTRRRAAEIERETVERSDLVVAVTYSTRDEMRSRYPGLPDRRFVCLSNGYDPAVFAGFQSRHHDGTRVVVTHLGTVYDSSSPRYYLDALDAMPDAVRSSIVTRFIGRVAAQEQAELESRKSPIEILGFMAQSDALRHVETTDYLLLTMTNEISLPGKLFEYLATGKPILAITPPGSEVDRILKRTNGGWCAAPGDRSGIQALISRAIEFKRVGKSFQSDAQAICRYERPRLAAEYGELIRSTMKGEIVPTGDSAVIHGP